MKAFAATLLAAALFGFGCQTPGVPVAVVADVDLDRYLGRWYEIASLPQYFQRGCVATSALYSRRDDGKIRVENQCRDATLDGPLRQAEGVAWQSEGPGSPGKLKVQFFWPFSGHYWVIALDPDYQWAIVGHPERKYLWILARTRTLDDAVYDSLVQRAEAMGYDLTRLERTLQPTAE